MRRRAIAALVSTCLTCVPLAGCSWIGGGDDVAPEKLYADTPCATECCCKTKKGYYAYFRCMDREPCESEGGVCERPDLARCSGT
jgi:hypothetical protein